MKRVFALIVTLVMTFSLFVTADASGEKIYYPSDIKNASQGVSITATEIKNCPRLHTNTDTNKSNKHISFFLSTARHTPIKTSDMTQRIP